MGEIGQVNLFIRFSPGAIWLDTGFSFEFLEQIVIEDVSPLQVSEIGGGTIRIRVRELGRDHKIFCRFGNKEASVAAKFDGISSLLCPAPSYYETGVIGKASVKLSLTLNQVDFVDYPRGIVYHEAHFLTRLDPLLGPSGGDTNVQVFGVGFEESKTYLCWFGNTASVARFLSRTSLLCIPPQIFLPMGKLSIRFPVHVSFDGEHLQTITSNPLAYTHYSALVHFELNPISGPSSGGTPIQINGMSALIAALSLHESQVDPVVAFGDIKVNAHFVGGEMFCESPQWDIESHPPNTVPVSVSLNGGSSFSKGYVAMFQYEAAVQLIEAIPSVVTVNVTKDILLIGTNFKPRSTLTCRFGALQVIATFIDNKTIRCALPSMPREYLSDFIALSVSLNGVDFSSDPVSLNIQTPPVATFLTPLFASARGGKVVTVTGTNLFSTNIALFASNPSMQTASDKHEVELSCESHKSCTFVVPTRPDVKKKESVTIFFMILMDVISSGLELTYLPLIEVDFIIPFSGARVGGYSVTIFGRYFDGAYPHECFFSPYSEAVNYSASVLEHSNNAIILNSTSTVCDVPPAATFAFGDELRHAFVWIERFDGEKSNKLQFTYSDRLLLNSLTPSTVFETGGSVLTVRGDFGQGSSFDCLFRKFNGSQVSTKAKLLSRYQLECACPVLSSGQVHVSVKVVDGTISAQNSLILAVRKMPHIRSLTPVSGPINGNTLVSVSGSGFQQNFDSQCKFKIYCRFGGSLVLANAKSDLELVCVSPLSPSSRKVPFTIAWAHRYNHDNIADIVIETSYSYEYQQLVAIEKVEPAIASIAGGTRASIYGSGFDNNQQMVVRFESHSKKKMHTFASIIYVSPDRIDFVIPPGIYLGIVETSLASVAVSANGQDFSSSEAVFSYIEPAVMLSVEPNLIPEQSHVSLTVQGNFTSDMYYDAGIFCRIGSALSPASWVTSGCLVCITPTNLFPGKYFVGLASNGHELFANPQRIVVRNRIKIVEAFPLLGPLRGNTRVTVLGEDFLAIKNSRLVCKFGTTITRASILNDTALECSSPQFTEAAGKNGTAYGKANTFPLKLAFDFHDGIDDDVETADVLDIGLYFQYYEAENIFNVEPSRGPDKGNTIIYIEGNNFRDTPIISCKIGNAPPQPATFINSTRVRCATPIASDVFGANLVLSDELKNDLSKAAVLVSNNGVDFEGHHIYSYYSEPVITSLSPNQGSERGGTIIILRGNFFPAFVTPFCQFGNVTIRGNVITNDKISCKSPAMSSVGDRTVQLGVSFNSYDFSDQQDLSFSYVIAPLIHSVFPAHGPSLGGNDVLIYGENFSDDMMCRFGGLYIVAKFISPTEAVCIPPNQLPGVVTLGVRKRSDGNYNEPITGAFYTYLTEILIKEIHPIHGSILGGTKLSVIGGVFPNIKDLCCVFDDVFVPAAWHSTNFVSCVVPVAKNDSAGPVSLSIGIMGVRSLNHGILSYHSVKFMYTEIPALYGVHPSRGLSTGVGVVTLSGENFHAYSLGLPSVSKTGKFPFVLGYSLVSDNLLHLLMWL